MKSIFSILLLMSSISFAEVNSNQSKLGANNEVGQPNIQKGNYQVGGVFSYTDQKNFTSSQLSPRFSYFIVNHLSVGLSGSYASSDAKDFKNYYSGNTTGFGPSIAYYFGSSETVVPFVALGVNYNLTRYSWAKEDFYSTSANPSVGAMFFINKALGFGLSYFSDIQLSVSKGDVEKYSPNGLQGEFAYYF